MKLIDRAVFLATNPALSLNTLRHTAFLSESLQNWRNARRLEAFKDKKRAANTAASRHKWLQGQKEGLGKFPKKLASILPSSQEATKSRALHMRSLCSCSNTISFTASERGQITKNCERLFLFCMHLSWRIATSSGPQALERLAEMLSHFHLAVKLMLLCKALYKNLCFTFQHFVCNSLCTSQFYISYQSPG